MTHNGLTPSHSLRVGFPFMLPSILPQAFVLLLEVEPRSLLGKVSVRAIATALGWTLLCLCPCLPPPPLLHLHSTAQSPWTNRAGLLTAPFSAPSPWVSAFPISIHPRLPHANTGQLSISLAPTPVIAELSLGLGLPTLQVQGLSKVWPKVPQQDSRKILL